MCRQPGSGVPWFCKKGSWHDQSIEKIAIALLPNGATNVPPLRRKRWKREIR